MTRDTTCADCWINTSCAVSNITEIALEACSHIETRITDCTFRRVIAAQAIKYIAQITARTVYATVIKTVA